MSDKLYKDQTKHLKWIIKNWELVKTDPNKARFKFRRKFYENLCIGVGLCYTCLLEDLPRELRETLFETFSKYSGDVTFPLSDFEDFETMKDFTETPERLELAKHCLKFLKAKRKEQQNK